MLTPLHRRFLLGLAALLVPLAGSCESNAPAPSFGRSEQPIYYGTREPQTLTLSEGEKLAIGWLFWNGNPRGNFCSATLVAPRVVATARHCLEDIGSASYVGFGVGLYPSNPRATFRAASIYLHPSVDAAVLVLTEDATARVPEIQAIPVNRVAPTSLRGKQVDGAGYGQTHDNSTGRYFAAVWLEYVGGSYLQIDGRGDQGMCFGDSGGPLLGPGPVLLGVESAGDQTCVDQDQMTRLDPIVDWFDTIAGGDPPPDPCDGLDYLGRCEGSVAEWCENGQVRQVDCASEQKACAYVDDQVGWYCVAQTTPPEDCGAVDSFGRCSGTVVEWCDENGAFQREDCADSNLLCGYVSAEVGWDCVEPTDGCGGVTAGGRCDGGVAVWCEGGQVLHRDCEAERLECGWSAEQSQYACVGASVPTACGDVDANGRCDGDVLVWCADGTRRQRDCAASGLACVALSDRSHTCEATPSTCTVDDEGCDGGVAIRCQGGALVRDPCAARGAICVHESPAAPRCLVEPPDPDPGPGPSTDPSTDPSADPGADPPATTGSDPSGGVGAPTSDDPDGAESAGSGCAAGGAAAPPWAALLFPLLALALRRRRARVQDF